MIQYSLAAACWGARLTPTARSIPCRGEIPEASTAVWSMLPYLRATALARGHSFARVPGARRAASCRGTEVKAFRVRPSPSSACAARAVTEEESSPALRLAPTGLRDLRRTVTAAR